jgi:hypothetical protein
LLDSGDVVLDLSGLDISNNDQNFSRKPSAKTASNFFNPADGISSAYSVADGAMSASGDYLGSYFFNASVATLVADPTTICNMRGALGMASARSNINIFIPL